jgi:hypothetical protein
VKIGEKGNGFRPTVEEPIKGMNIDIDINSNQVKKFTRIYSSGKFEFYPEAGDEGIYNMSLIVTINM